MKKNCLLCGSFQTAVKWGFSKQKRVRYRCGSCLKTFNSRCGTMRFYSHLSDGQWKRLPDLLALRTHPSGADLGRLLSRSTRTGQRLLRMVRRTLPKADAGLSGKRVTEFDETTFEGRWIGGAKQKWGKLALRTLSNRGMKTLNKFVDETVTEGSTVFTDEWRGYLELQHRYEHFTVCHAREFVSEFCPAVHTNSIEGVWGYAKPLAWHTYRGYPFIPDFLRELCFSFNFNYAERRNFLSAKFFRSNTNTICA